VKVALANWFPSALLSGLTVLVTVSLDGQTLPPACMAGDNGSGTVSMPPEGCVYQAPQPLDLADLPSGTTIRVQPISSGFLCGENGLDCTRRPGGTLGGEIESFPSAVRLRLTGTGRLAGFHKIVTLPARIETHVAPRRLGQTIQPFAAEMVSLEGAMAGNPVFAVLRVSAGRAHGMPSPGKTVLTRQADGRFKVESTLRIAYRIVYRGAAGGPLAGRAGTTRGTVLMKAFEQPQ
jgi:hypothetical protein